MEKEIADEIIARLTDVLPNDLVSSTGFWLVSISILLAILALGAFGASYVKKLGEQYASKEDVNKLVEKTEALTQATEEIKFEVKARFDDQQLALQHSMQQELVLHEATRLIARFSEIFRNQPDQPGDFAEDYSQEWRPDKVSLTSLESNKRDTCVYRFFRFLSAIEQYRHSVSGLQSHENRYFFDFYLDQKLIPVLASDRLPGDFVLWRDAAMELGEVMTEKSEKWEVTRPINWSHFVEMIQGTDGTSKLVNSYAEFIANFIKEKNVRLAIFSVLLIDLLQDNRNFQSWEKERNHILSYISERAQPNEFSIWGRTMNNQNDWEAMDISAGKVPRNIRSPFFDVDNNLGYPVTLKGAS